MPEKKKNHPKQAGIIDIGAHAVRMDLFQLDRTGSPKLWESMSRSLDLGSDVDRTGEIQPATLTVLADAVRNFQRKITEYGIPVCRTIATSALREAFNRELVSNRIKHDAGLNVEILEAEDEARITFLAMREELNRVMDFMSLSGIVFIVGTGSLIILYFENGIMRFCESVNMGLMGIAGDARSGSRNGHMEELLAASAVDRRIRDCMTGNAGVQPVLIGLGAGVRLLVRHQLDSDDAAPLELDITEAAKRAEAGIRQTFSPAFAKKNMPEYLVKSLPPCGRIMRFFLQNFRFSKFICPTTTTRSALIGDMLREQHVSPEQDPFRADLLASAECLGRRYELDLRHARTVTAYAMTIYDKLHRQFDFPPRFRTVLETAALLHDIGRFVGAKDHHLHSYYIIRHSPLPGLSTSERLVAACAARYHRRETPQSNHGEYITLGAEEKVAVLQVSAILRVADALDWTHGGDAKPLTVKLHRGELQLFKGDPHFDPAQDPAALAAKGGLFYDVFGLRLKLAEAVELLV